MPVSFKQKMPLGQAQALADGLVELLRCDDRVAQTARTLVCGSIRRRKPEAGDIDLVVDSDLALLHQSDLMNDSGDVLHWVEGGEKKATLSFAGQQVNVLRSDAAHWGAAILYFTGPYDYNIGMRRLAKGRGLLLNEKGLFRGSELLAAQTEESIYDALGKQYKDPWLRGVK